LVLADVDGGEGNENGHSSQLCVPAADTVHCSW